MPFRFPQACPPDGASAREEWSRIAAAYEEPLRRGLRLIR